MSTHCHECGAFLMSRHDFDAPFFRVSMIARGGTVDDLRYSISDMECMVCSDCYVGVKTYFRPLTKVEFTGYASHGGTGMCFAVNTRDGYQGAMSFDHQKELHFISRYVGDILLPEVTKTLTAKDYEFLPLFDYAAKEELAIHEAPKSRYDLIQED